MTWENEYEDIYEIMNLLENAVRRRNADAGHAQQGRHQRCETSFKEASTHLT